MFIRPMRPREAPCSKLRGIFDPQGRFIMLKRSFLDRMVRARPCGNIERAWRTL